MYSTRLYGIYVTDAWIKYLKISWRSVVHTSAADCRSDFLPDVPFLTLFSPTFQAAKQHNLILFCISCFGRSVSSSDKFRCFAVLCTFVSYNPEAKQVKPRIKKRRKIQTPFVFSRHISYHVNTHLFVRWNWPDTLQIHISLWCMMVFFHPNLP